MRQAIPAMALMTAALGLGCAGPAKLAMRSEEKLAEGDLQRAWSLAVKALDKAPGNLAARSAADAAADAIATDWQRRIHALASVDSLAAAQQVVEFTAFRAGAARYATVTVDDAWVGDEHALRHAAARFHYEQATGDLDARRPKKAYRHLIESERYVTGYRDAARLADHALERGLTRVAFVPLAHASKHSNLGRDVAASWRGDIAEHMPPDGSSFTRILPIEDVERVLRLADLDGLSRSEAARAGRRAGADRVVWGTIGMPDAKTSIHVFSDLVARRVIDKDESGRRTTRWEEVPIEVVARVRTVRVPLEYEVISAQGGATLARSTTTQTITARALWTVFDPQGNPSSYTLISEPSRAADPKRAKRIEKRWQAVAGDRTSLADVLEARRSRSRGASDPDPPLARFMAGAAFVLLEELPPAEDLAYAAVSGAWHSILKDLARLDAVDDVDLGLAVAGGDR